MTKITFRRWLIEKAVKFIKYLAGISLFFGIVVGAPVIIFIIGVMIAHYYGIVLAIIFGISTVIVITLLVLYDEYKEEVKI